MIEYKSVAVGGVSEVKDEGDGIVTAYVSVTGVEDNVKDIIEPGAYTKTLKKRTPKGVWGHSWTTPTSKTLEAKELLPGSPELPKTLSDGTPWPKEAGALKIKMQFNLATTRGREAYSDVMFFGPQQEWSIGYTVPDGKSYKDPQGRRRIKELDLFEYSAVLFGAMSHARTHSSPTSVKDAQLARKVMEGVSLIELKSLEDSLAQFRKDHAVEAPTEGESGSDFVGDEASSDLDETSGDEDDTVDDEVDEEELDDEEDDDYDEEDEDDEEKSIFEALSSSMSVKELRSAYSAIGAVLDVLNTKDDSTHIEIGYKALIEAKATGYDTVRDAVDAIDVNLDASDAKTLQDAAEKLDWALQAGDQDAATESANDLLDTLEKVMDVAEENGDDDLSLKTVARTVADKTGGKPGDDEEEEDWEDEPTTDGDGEEDEEDEDWRGKKVFGFISSNGIEYKNGPWAGRTFGGPVGGEDLDAKTRQCAFVCGLPNEALVALNYVLREVSGNVALKGFVQEEIEDRMYAGRLTEEKLSMPMSGGGGQHGRGGGRHRQAAEGRTPGSGMNFGETGARPKTSAKRLKKAAKGVKKAGVAPTKTVKAVRSAKKTVNSMAGGDRTQHKRDFSGQQRQTAAARGNAMPDGSFPINNETDLKNAIRACGRAKDQEAAKAHIKKRAKAMGKENLIPDEWKTAVVDMAELKSLEVLVAETKSLS